MKTYSKISLVLLALSTPLVALLLWVFKQGGVTSPVATDRKPLPARPVAMAPEEAEAAFVKVIGFEGFDEAFGDDFFDGFGAVIVSDKFAKLSSEEGRVVGIEYIPMDDAVRKLTVEVATERCGLPIERYDSEVFWGRVGMILKPDRSLDSILVRRDWRVNDPTK